MPYYGSLQDYLPFLVAGIPVTLMITALAMAVALPVSVVLALGRSSRFGVLRWSAGFVIELVRGSSSLVQLFWAFYVLPFFGVTLPPLVVGVAVLGLNSGSYFSEVVRAGLNAVPRGQYEAALTLGFSAPYRFFRIMVPQALPIIIPPFGNAVITMLKFTALVSLVTIQDLTFRAGLVSTSTGQSGLIYSMVLVTYFILAMMLAGGTKLLEGYVNRRSGRHTSSGSAERVPDWAVALGK
jgi:polar amino acid transport system permease protein